MDNSEQIKSLLAKSDFFASLDETSLDTIIDKFSPVLLASGDCLMQKGDPGDCLYLVGSGLLRAYVGEPPKAIGEMSRGDLIGELALLTGESRLASVYAIRDSLTYRLNKADFDEIFSRHHAQLLSIFSYAFKRVQAVRKRDKHRLHILALVPAGTNPHFAEQSATLVKKMQETQSVFFLSSKNIKQQLGFYESQDIVNIDALNSRVNRQLLTAKLETINQHHDLIILQSDKDLTPWSQYCLSQVDKILLCADFDSSHELNALETSLSNVPEHIRPSCELALFRKPSAILPRDTGRWLNHRLLFAHHHVPLESDKQLTRLVRLFLGQSHGLVLSGGGARGLAHLGVYKALIESGQIIDCIGGTSAGAIMGSLVAINDDIDWVKETVKQFLSDNKKIMDYTLPLSSIMRGKKITDALQQAYDTDFHCEDLAMRFFSVATNLNELCSVIQTRGPLWRHIRATLSLPAIFPPVPNALGQLLVDGGVINNLPVDVMEEFANNAKITAVNVTPLLDYASYNGDSGWLSGWSLLKEKLFHSKKSSLEHYPNIVDIIAKSMTLSSASHKAEMAKRADVTIECHPSHYALMDFSKVDEIVELGYRDAMAALEKLDKTKP